MQVMARDQDPKCQHGVFLQTWPQNRKRMQKDVLVVFIYRYNVKNSDMFFQYRNRLEDFYSFFSPISKK